MNPKTKALRAKNRPFPKFVHELKKWKPDCPKKETDLISSINAKMGICGHLMETVNQNVASQLGKTVMRYDGEVARKEKTAPSMMFIKFEHISLVLLR